MENWTDLYIEIAERINNNLDEVRWLDLWHEQVNFLTEEHPFDTPAIFISFTTLDTDDRGLWVQDCNTQIDFYLFYETFSDTYFGSYNQDRAIEYLRTLTRLHALFHGKKGHHYSQMRRVGMGREESGGAGNLYRVSFQCLVTDYSAQKLFVETENPERELRIKKGQRPDQTQKGLLYDLS